MASLSSFSIYLAVILASLIPARAQLSPHFYDKLCPEALPIIGMVVQQAVAREPRMGASLLRLHFHDCFVDGCDGSILLDDTPTFTGEKTAAPNNNSVRGFDVVDNIKAAVNAACHGNVVSCADILAVAARDSVVALGGPSYEVLVGRRDSRTANLSAANNNIPPPSSNFSTLLSSFQSQGLSMKDLVTLSGCHTIGLSKCTNFKSRLYNETTNIDAGLASILKPICPISGGDDNLAPLDATTTRFDGVYFKGLLQKKGLLHSDQVLFKGDGSGSDGLVLYYSENPDAFWEDFVVSMINMGNLSPLIGYNGEVRMDCRKVN